MKLAQVNQRDIRGAIHLGCRTMSDVFDADDHDIPFFRSTVLPTPRFGFSEAHSEAHVPGRHLNALLTAEDLLGIAVSEEAIEKHTRAAFFSYSGPIPLPLNRKTQDGPLQNFLPHNIREGFHALYALIRYRNSEVARRMAEDSIASIIDLWTAERGWDLPGMEAKGLSFFDPAATHISGVARAIGPLVKIYKTTGHTPALDLAQTLKERTLEDFPPDGHYDPIRQGYHTHSTTCVLSSLAQLADLTKDKSLMTRVKAFYDNGLNAIRDELGWSIESSSPSAEPDRGEGNNSGDIVETALLLGRWGWPEYYQDAECILRNHLLPSQLRDLSFIAASEEPAASDAVRKVRERHLGAFGFPAPYGHFPIGANPLSVAFNLDIVGGVVASLCEAFREASRYEGAGHRINLLFDHETEHIRVRSLYGRKAFEIVPKVQGSLSLRIPPWTDPDSIRISPESGKTHFSNHSLNWPEVYAGSTIKVSYPLSERHLTLTHRTRTIKTSLRGDEVVAMENHGAELTFFDEL